MGIGWAIQITRKKMETTEWFLLSDASDTWRFGRQWAVEISDEPDAEEAEAEFKVGMRPTPCPSLPLPPSGVQNIVLSFIKLALPGGPGRGGGASVRG